MKRIALLIAIAGLGMSLLNGCAATHKKTVGELISIEPNGFYEACDKWAPGQKVNYSFQTSAKVNFDVHYHTADGKEYPQKEDGVSKLDGSFVVDKEAIYCCMWANPHSKSVGLTYEFEVLGAK